MGVVGLSFGDFCILTFDEFESIVKAHREREERMRRDEWERMRLHAVMTMQPHCRKKLDPKKVLPFEWEKSHSHGNVNTTPELSKDEAKEAFMRRIGRKVNAEK
ncbi:MAG: hypothetical protein K2L45_03295 [Muribaculaceae bacterium]|nr:hypothetical protein [Muribaculaceae bacterium]